ncbi:MAG: hypothetical protein JNJ77_09135 [Planctomycetia bacterium]|nr:hypothetical protein [Planctomycetia bacterium]
MMVFLLLLTFVLHDLCAKVERQGNQLQIEAWFDNDTPADLANVRILQNDIVIRESKTDDRGLCTMPAPDPGKYVLQVHAGGGHRTEVAFTIESQMTEQAAGRTHEEVQQRRWWGTLAGLALIALLTVFARKLIPSSHSASGSSAVPEG